MSTYRKARGKGYRWARRAHPFNPKLLLLISLILGSPLANAGIVAQWQGGNLSNEFGLGGGYVPPDMGGSVGGYVMQMLNGYVATYDTQSNMVGSATSLNTFWNNAGLSSAIGSTAASDPRLIYDPASQRWFASAISTQSTSNNILIAVSNSSNPTQGFTGFSLASPSDFADFPTLAIDNNAVTIGINNFSSSSGSYTGSSVYSIPTSSLLAISPSLNGFTAFHDTNQLGGGFTPEGVTNFYGSGTGSTVLSTNYGTNGLNISTVSGAGTAAATLTQTSYISSILGTLPTAPTQPGGTSYDQGDNRISSGVYQVGNLIYFTNNVSVDGSDQIQWGILDATTNTIVHTGLIGVSGLDLTYPSISANANGTFVISFIGSGSNSNIDAYYVICSTVTSLCSAPVQDFAGLASNYDISPGGTNRWGDYSWTTVDPNNSNNFWLFQEVPLANNEWGTTSALSLSSVPEPPALLIFSTGLIMLGLVSSLRRSNSKAC